MRTVPASFQGALSFLTVFPSPCAITSVNAAERMSQALAWFPLVGGLIGGASAAIMRLASSFWSSEVSVLLGVVSLILFTGGLHLDGFADTVDGLAAGRDKEETLRIMQDSRVGALGAAGLFLLLGLKWSVLSSIPTHRWVASLTAACALSRFSLVLAAHYFPYVPGKSGLGRLVTERRSRQALTAASVLAVGISMVSLGPFQACAAVGLTCVATWGFNGFLFRRLGGITGDTLGALSEITETALLLFLAAMGNRYL